MLLRSQYSATSNVVKTIITLSLIIKKMFFSRAIKHFDQGNGARSVQGCRLDDLPAVIYIYFTCFTL